MTHPVGIVFPGQGSQTIKMLSDIASQYKEVLDIFAESSTILGYDLWQLIQVGPAEKLNQTIHTQPALLTASYAIWQIVQSRKPMKAAILVGHSLGEYTALVCANSLDFADALRLVSARGQYMQEAVREGVGAMAAIVGLEDTTVLEICAKVTTKDEIVSPANFNSLGQIVVAGHKVAVERAIVLAKEKGAKLATLIPVSVPSHCQLMHPAAIRLQAQLETVSLRLPELTVVNNVAAKPYDSIAAIREGLVKQLYSPVRWVETIQYFIQQGVNTIIECGPAKVLTGLNKRIDKNLQLMTTDTLSNLNHIISTNEEGLNHVS